MSLIVSQEQAYQQFLIFKRKRSRLSEPVRNRPVKNEVIDVDHVED